MVLIVGIAVGAVCARLLGDDPKPCQLPSEDGARSTLVEFRDFLKRDFVVRPPSMLCSEYAELARRGLRERRLFLVETGVRGLARCRTAEAQAILSEVIEDESVGLPSRAGQWFAGGFKGMHSESVADAAVRRWREEKEREHPTRSRRLDAWLEIVAETGGARHLNWLVGAAAPYAGADLGSIRAVAVSSNPLAITRFRDARLANSSFSKFDFDHFEGNRHTLLSFVPAWIANALRDGRNYDAGVFGTYLVELAAEDRLPGVIEALTGYALYKDRSYFAVPVAQALAERGVDPEDYAVFVGSFDMGTSAIRQVNPETSEFKSKLDDLTTLFSMNPVLWSEDRLETLRELAEPDILPEVEQWLELGWQPY